MTNNIDGQAGTDALNNTEKRSESPHKQHPELEAKI
jgi:hypothetical protein